jgi:hypothetical protein
MRLSSLRARLRRIEILIDPHLFMVQLDGESAFVTWDFLMRGVQDAGAGINSHAAQLVLCGSSSDEYALKLIEMVYATTHPVET